MLFCVPKSIRRAAIVVSFLVGATATGMAADNWARELPALPTANRTASTLKQLRDIVHGTNGVTKIGAGQCVQLNDGDYLNDATGNNTNPGNFTLTAVFDPPITIRSTTRRYNGYGPNGGLTSGGAIFRKAWVVNSTGMIFDGLAGHRGNIGQWIDEPAVHLTGARNITFRCMEFFGFVPTGSETDWATMIYNNTYNVQWNQQGIGIRRHTTAGSVVDKLTVEHCYFHFIGGKMGLYLAYCTDVAMRYNAFEYLSGDAVKFEGMTGVFEGNVMWKFFPTMGSSGDIGHTDAFQSTSKNTNATSNVTFKNNLMMDRGRGKLQGIFAELDVTDGGTYVGVRQFNVEDNIIFISSSQTARGLSIDPSGGGNVVRNNTVLSDVHGGVANPNIMLLLEKSSSAADPTGDVAEYNVADSYSLDPHVAQTGNQAFAETTYDANLYDYSASKPAIEGLLVNGVLQPDVVRRLSWKVGSTSYDPNHNGGAGAWKAFQYYEATPPGWVAPGSIPPAEVVGRRVFYRNSKFDGNGNVTKEDDAIAPDKQALLPGQTATFSNYTSYSRGINGILLDVMNLAGTVSAADFTFKVGNSDTPGTWSAAPAPQSMTQRPGPNGSTRISIVWANNAIQKQWLQVTLKATANTNLPTDDVFYFGNAIGEAGDSSANALVNPTDEYLTRINPRTLLNPAPINFPYDFDRDGLVNPTDGYIARINPATLLTSIRLVTVP